MPLLTYASPTSSPTLLVRLASPRGPRPLSPLLPPVLDSPPVPFFLPSDAPLSPPPSSLPRPLPTPTQPEYAADIAPPSSTDPPSLPSPPTDSAAHARVP